MGGTSGDAGEGALGEQTPVGGAAGSAGSAGDAATGGSGGAGTYTCSGAIVDDGCPSYPTMLDDNVNEHFANAPGVPHGTLVEDSFGGGSRDESMMIYLPAGYDECDEEYPVLYLNHGGGNNYTNWSATAETPPHGEGSGATSDWGAAGLIADNLIASGDAVPMIIVMPDGNDCWGNSLSTPPTSADGQCSSKYKSEIIPFVEGKYRVRKDRNFRAIAGLSMGGYTTMSVGLPNTELFSFQFVFSAGWATSDAQNFIDLVTGIYGDTATINGMLNAPYYMACGVDDTTANIGEYAVQTSDVYGAAGLNVHWDQSSGFHSWTNWRRYLHQVLQVAFTNQQGCGN